MSTGVDASGHPAARITAAASYTRDNLLDHLRRYAYYGIAATASLGLDRGELPYELRATPTPGSWCAARRR